MSPDTEIPYGLSRKFNLSQRHNPHIYWSPYGGRWYVTWSNRTDYTRNDYAAQDYVNTLNQTKQAHPVK